MTWIICSSCNRTTFAYGNNCEHCGKSLKDGNEVTPLYGLGGEPLPRYFCHKCGFVNEADAKVCQDCGQDLSELSESDKEELTIVLSPTPQKKSQI